jgi:hypothetical protein
MRSSQVPLPFRDEPVKRGWHRAVAANEGSKRHAKAVFTFRSRTHRAAHRIPLTDY